VLADLDLDAVELARVEQLDAAAPANRAGSALMMVALTNTLATM
jgi:hypothetical protein